MSLPFLTPSQRRSIHIAETLADVIVRTNLSEPDEIKDIIEAFKMYFPPVVNVDVPEYKIYTKVNELLELMLKESY